MEEAFVEFQEHLGGGGLVFGDFRNISGGGDLYAGEGWTYFV